MSGDVEWFKPVNAGDYPCKSGKKQHDTKAEAIRGGKGADARTGGKHRQGGRTAAYRCDFCGFWHLGRR